MMIPRFLPRIVTVSPGWSVADKRAVTDGLAIVGGVGGGGVEAGGVEVFLQAMKNKKEKRTCAQITLGRILIQDTNYRIKKGPSQNERALFLLFPESGSVCLLGTGVIKRCT